MIIKYILFVLYFLNGQPHIASHDVNSPAHAALEVEEFYKGQDYALYELDFDSSTEQLTSVNRLNIPNVTVTPNLGQ